MQRALSFQQSPAPGVPLRFLFTAPLFVLLAALLLLWSGPSALASRWTGPALALTHLFTLGVLANAMAGALMQILPVATGVSALAPRATSVIVHTLLNLGTLSLAAAFLSFTPWMFALALGLLCMALGVFLAACAGGLWKYRKQATKGSTEILATTRLALAALLAATILGAMLAASFAWPLPFSRALTNAHGAWGLLGWVGLLVVGISYQVIPIFQVTEIYPKPVTRWLAPTIFVLLAAYMANTLAPPAMRLEIDLAISAVALAAYTIYAVVTLRLLWTRKRPKADATTRFWHTAMLCLAACGPVWLAQAAGVKDLSVSLGVLFIVGFGWSAVNGMLYKIIPFLLWYHAQRDLAIALRVVPKVKDFIPDAIAARQYWAHLAALLLLLSASLLPAVFAHAAGLALAISAAWLLLNMTQALRFYLRARKRIALALAELPQP
ncbi:MAG: hypothetical protein WBA83_16600 [Burkholderiaceae bacterium]